MAFDNTTAPVLTAYNVSGDTEIGLPASSPVTGNFAYNTAVSYAGPGGNFEIQTTGNLEQIAGIASSGLIGIVVPGVEVAAIQLTGGTGISSVLTGTDFVISVVPSTTVQLIHGQANSTAFGQARNTINLIPGTGIGITPNDSGSVLSWTISANAGAGVTAPFVIYTADATLTGAQNIGLLTTGLLKNTVSGASSTLSTAVSGTDYLLPNANLNAIGALSPQNGDLLAYYGSAWNLIAPGSVGQVLTTLSTTSLGWVSNGSGDVTLAGAQTFTGVKTFTPQQIFTNSIQIPLGAGAGKVLGSDASGNATWTVAGAGNVTLAGANVFTGTNTFNTNIPTTTLTPTAPTQFVTKAFTDATYALLGGPTLAATQTWTGANTYSQTIAAPSITMNNAFNNVNVGFQNLGNYSGSSTGNNVAVGRQTLGAFSGGTATVGIGYQAGSFVGAGDYNTFLGSQTGYASAFDGPFSHSTAVGANSVITASNQIVMGTAADTVVFMGTSPLQIPNGATLNYVLTCTDATSGAASWQVSSGSGGGTTASISTTNAATTTLATIAVPSDQAITVNGILVARNTSGTISDTTGGRFTCTAVNTGGTVALAATPDVSVQATSTGTFNLVASGSNLLIQVNGIDSTAYDWTTNYTTIVL